MNKKLQHIAFAFIGLLLINYLSNAVYKRFDLTQDKRYTISDVSSKLLNKLDDNVLINVYLEGNFPAEFKRLQTETRLHHCHQNVHRLLAYQ